MQHISLVEEFYRPLLLSIGYSMDEEGVISLDGTSMDVAKKTLALPLEDNLKNMNPERVLFHPLSENITRGDSPVFTFLRASIAFRVNTDITTIIRQLLALAIDQEKMKRLNSKQLEVMIGTTEVNDKTLKLFNKAIAGLDLTDNALYYMYNKRNGEINGDVYNRVSVVTFPIVKGLMDGDARRTFWESHKLRKADYSSLLALFNSVIPNVLDVNAYSAGSDAMDAPSFYALVKGFVKIEQRLSEIVTMFADIVDFGSTKVCMEHLPAVVKALDNPDRFKKLIPDLDGNIGELAVNAPPPKTAPVGVPPSDLSRQLHSKTNSIQLNENPVAHQQPQVQQQYVTQAPVQQQQQTHQSQENKFSGFNTDIKFDQVFSNNQQQYGNQQYGNNGQWGTNGVSREEELYALMNSSNAAVREKAIAEMRTLKGGSFNGQQNGQWGQQQYGGQWNNGGNNQWNGGQPPVMTREQQLMELMKSPDPVVSYNASRELNELQNAAKAQAMAWQTQQQQQGFGWSNNQPWNNGGGYYSTQGGYNMQAGYGGSFGQPAFGAPVFAGK